MTIFRCQMGYFCFQVMPVGMKNAATTFQRAVAILLGDLSILFVYIDDILVGSETCKEHFGHLATVMGPLRNVAPKLKVNK